LKSTGSYRDLKITTFTSLPDSAVVSKHGCFVIRFFRL